MLQPLMLASGITFLAGSAFMLAYPEYIIENFGLQQEIAQLLPLILGLVGLGDVIVALFVFRSKDRK